MLKKYLVYSCFVFLNGFSQNKYNSEKIVEDGKGRVITNNEERTLFYQN